MPDRLFGVVGKTLTHSFSPDYFKEKFRKENIGDAAYERFELENVSEIPRLFSNSALIGVNVTIPYKEQVIPFLDELHESAKRVGAVNVVKKEGNELIGYNTDEFGFRTSLTNWIEQKVRRALILGTGGASKAVKASLDQEGILYKEVSREPNADQLSYQDLKSREMIRRYELIINTTPLGTYPDIDQCPPIPYDQLTSDHFLYDLVYNPSETRFLKRGKEKGASAKNGLEMLELQAERSWEIWNS